MPHAKKKRSGNWNRNEWHVKHSEPSPKNLRSSFLSFCSVCVCYAFVLSSYWQFYFVQIYAALCSADLSKHTDTQTHLQRRVGVSSDCDGDWGFLCILFFNEMCVVVVKSAVAVWRHLYFCKIPLIITHKHTHANRWTPTLLSFVCCSHSRVLSLTAGATSYWVQCKHTTHSLTHTGAYVLRGE